jgi:hypothetical protein
MQLYANWHPANYQVVSRTPAPEFVNAHALAAARRGILDSACAESSRLKENPCRDRFIGNIETIGPPDCLYT